jgi:hypothetical protein
MSTEITIQQDQIDINVTQEVIVIESPTGGYPLPSSVYSVFGRVGNVVAEDGDYDLTQLGDVTISNPLTGQSLIYNGTGWVNSTETYTGTVTSVNMSVPTGLTISGNPITTAGTLALGMASGYSIPTTASQSTWDTAYSRSLTSAAVTGTTTKTLTLNEQGGGTITATWSDYDTAPVTSVFGRTGAVVAQSGDYTTLLVPENTNLYFTDQRARYAISGDSNSGVVYQNTTGIIALDDIPNTSLLHDSITINGYLTALGGTVTLTTTDVAEGTNLYYTQARFNSAFAAKTTTDLAEGTNLYFTTARAQAAITGTSPISVTSGNVSISQANATTNGYLSSTDWAAFNAKQAALTFSSPLVNTSGTVSIPAATSSVNGYLSSTDWATFNDKQNALSGTGFVKINGTTISYDNSTYLTTIDGITAGGELSGTYANPSLVNSAVTGKVLTGVNITGGTIQATDSILTAFGKVQNQINGLIGGSIYKGTWNASTNTPALASGVGTTGWYYIVNVAGTTNLDGITDWNVGDWAIFDGTAWQQVDNTDAVVSVNGFTGAVSLTTSNISEGTNLYYTDTRARAALSAGTGISYSSSTGVITNSAPDQTVSLTGAGTTSISGTYPNFTITSNDQYTGTVTSVGITESSAALTITGSPVTTSGNINIGFAGTGAQYVAGDGSLVTFPTSIDAAGNLVTEVYNSTGATLTKGTVVYINGGQGNLPTVTKAQANSEANSAQTYGLVRADITNMNNGYVTVAGSLGDLNTNGFTDGTTLYLSPTTAGAYTSTKPTSPDHIVYIGVVVRAHPTQGVIEVNIQNTQELSESSDVLITSPTGGQILQYDGTASLWKNVAGTTSNISEGTNLYYTDARARGAISLTTTGNNGASTYNSTTGALNVPTYTLAGLGGINLTSLSATSPLLYNNTTGVFSIQQASGSQAGYLSSADWTTFNNKASTASLANYLPLTGGTLTGALTGTTATFIGGNNNTLKIDNGGQQYTSLYFANNGTQVAGIYYDNTNNTFYFDNQKTNPKLSFTGAATFSSSLRVGGATGNFIIDTYTTSKIGVRSWTDIAGTTNNFFVQNSANYNYGVIGVVSATGASNGDIYGLGYTPSAGTSMTPVINWTSGGNVGIGTTSPISTLDVSSTSPTITIRNSSQKNWNSGDQIGYLDQYLDDTSSAGARVVSFVRSIVSNGVSSGITVASDLIFGTANYDATATEKMRINNSGNVGIGTSSPVTYSGYTSLHIAGATSTGSAILYLTNSTSSVRGLVYAEGNLSRVTFGSQSNHDVTFVSNDTERMRITSGGKVMVHTTDSGPNAYLFASANMNQPYPLGAKAEDTSQGLVGFFDNGNNTIGSISRSGDVVSYNSFLGSHWSQLKDNSTPEILRGTILEAIDELCEWDGETNDRLAKVKISDTLESKNVYGVFLGWDNTDDFNDMYVAALGAGYIRVNSNEVVSMGDLLQSNGDGTAKVQLDDIMRSSTIAKVVSTQKIETYEDGSYLIAATIHCG